MQSLARKSDQNIHYSSVVSVSKQDAVKLREFFVEQLEHAKYNRKTKKLTFKEIQHGEKSAKASKTTIKLPVAH